MFFQPNRAFFDLFESLASRVVPCAAQFRQLAVGFPGSTAEMDRLRDESQAAHELTRKTLRFLDRTFLPPIDRSDALELAGELDGIVVLIERTGRRLRAYRIESIEPLFVEQAQVLVQSAVSVREAVHRLRSTRRLSTVESTLSEIHRLKRIGDDNHDSALSKLFDGSSPPLFVVAWKDLHALLEQAIDACGDVGNTLERIALKSL